jgi:hypothetical protein
MNLKVKIICGFRKDQQYSIDAEEAHKAYYLFLNPEKRGIFKNGIAIIGKNIQSIEPDYQATMGWNESHTLEGDDWNEINKLNVKNLIAHKLEDAKEVATLLAENPKVFALPLSEVRQTMLESGIR